MKKIGYIETLYIELDEQEELNKEFESDGMGEFMMGGAIDLIRDFFDKRFETECKQYNNNYAAINDKHIVERNLNLLNVYIEDLMLLEEDSNTSRAMRNRMRSVLLALWNAVNTFSDKESSNLKVPKHTHYKSGEEMKILELQNMLDNFESSTVWINSKKPNK